jgi:hypothetical protein
MNAKKRGAAFVDREYVPPSPGDIYHEKITFDRSQTKAAEQINRDAIRHGSAVEIVGS